VISVSDHYRKLEPEEVPILAAEFDANWKDPSIPQRQWISTVRAEIERFREGESFPHFEVLLRLLKRIPIERPTLLDVGASSGFYREILRIGGFACDYTACDYSEEYERLAKRLFPGIAFKVGDARALPFDDSSFDCVLSGCCLLHIADYEKVIAETARVAKYYTVFNRTPILTADETTFFEKHAYNVPTLEIHFSEAELLGLFDKYGLSLVASEDVFFDEETHYGHRTYLLRKANYE
jgi:SAM-dependent methyltransferase